MYPLCVGRLSTMMDSLAPMNPFVCNMYRFLLCGCFLGCFRISEMLQLRWNDVSRGCLNDKHYVSIRLRWHKKANVEEECQVYNLVDEPSFLCLKICGIYDDFLASVRLLASKLPDNSYVFPNISNLHSNRIVVDWTKHIEQNTIRSFLQNLVESNPNLNIGISLHSMRRGGAFYRVFESPHNRFNFRQLMAWCRWKDASTCCEYLITRSLSNEVDPRNLLLHSSLSVSNTSNALDPTVVAELVACKIGSLVNVAPPARSSPEGMRQTNLQSFVVMKTIPTANDAKEAWNQWYLPNPELGLFRALQDFTSEMRNVNKRRYSERQTLALAFAKYATYEEFEAGYKRFPSSFRKVLDEVRRRKASGKL